MGSVVRSALLGVGSHAWSWVRREAAPAALDVAAAAVTAALVDAAFAAAQRKELGDWCRRELALYEASAWTRYLMFPDSYPRPEAPYPSPEAQELLRLVPLVQHQWAPVPVQRRSLLAGAAR